MNLESKDARGVNLETGVPEGDQEGSFQNATLQGAGDSLAFSIATHLDIPEAIARDGEDAVAGYITEQLARAAAVGVPGLRFTVQLGASRDAPPATPSDLIAVVSGSFSLGMTVERVVSPGEFQGAIDALRVNGVIAQGLPVEHPSMRDKSLAGSDGDVFVLFSDGYPGSGTTVCGPFPDEDSAEDFGETHRVEDGEYSVAIFENVPRRTTATPRG